MMCNRNLDALNALSDAQNIVVGLDALNALIAESRDHTELYFLFRAISERLTAQLLKVEALL